MNRAPSPGSKKSNPPTSLLVGIWLGLVFLVGAGTFLGLYWLQGGFAGMPPLLGAPTATTEARPTVFIPTTTPAGGGAASPACNYPPPPPSGFGYGIQSHVYPGQTDFDYWMSVIDEKLHLQWVKIQVRWADMEWAPGEVDWSTLDGLMPAACRRGLRVMLSIVSAPVWTRANPLPLERGEAPPDDYRLYADFVGRIIDRYPGQVGAIEVWNEENLEREWNTAAGVNASDYVRLLQTTYTIIESKEPNIIVIAGAPSPTGINCNVSWPDCQPAGRPIVVDDATYLRQFMQAGGLQYADCMGVHSNGTNLPPTADGAKPPGDGSGYSFKGPWQSPHYSWALRSQVETYAQILQGQKPLCVTEFGYASAVDGLVPPGFEFARDVSEVQQAEYVVQAFEWLRNSGYVKIAFLFNLDYGPKGGDPAVDDNVLFSILDKQGIPRPAFDTLSLMPKP